MDDDLQKLFIVAWAQGNLKEVAAIHAKGARLVKKILDCTSLIAAGQYNQCDIIEYLLSKGANIELLNEQRCTGLHIAS